MKRTEMGFCTNKTGMESMDNLIKTLEDVWHKARYTYEIVKDLPNPGGTTETFHLVKWQRK